MTDSQVRYQQVAETQRHNLMMERLGQQEADSKTLQAEAAKQQASTAERRLTVENKQWAAEQAQGWTDMMWNRGNQTAKNVVDFIGSVVRLFR